ncbi:hypothetical protein C8F01DRAFT_1134774 [Mycena amicta]|nr:hypothetical protein C8F01DRAFT_1134774 [Mycena amicta]
MDSHHHPQPRHSVHCRALPPRIDYPPPCLSSSGLSTSSSHWHPLSSIPGPWYAAVSSLWITTHVLRLEECKTIHALFQTYGSVVRIAPNKIALGTMESIYSTYKFDKSDYYTSLLTNANDHAITTLSHGNIPSAAKPTPLAIHPSISRAPARSLRSYRTDDYLICCWKLSSFSK